MQTRVFSEGQIITSDDCPSRASTAQPREKKMPLCGRNPVRAMARTLLPMATILSIFWMTSLLDRPVYSVIRSRFETGQIVHQLNRLRALNYALTTAQAHARSVAIKRTEEIAMMASYGLPTDMKDLNPMISFAHSVSEVVQPLSEQQRQLQANLVTANQSISPPSKRKPHNSFEGVYPKVWTYPLPAKFNTELSHRYKRCISDQYGTEVLFHQSLAEAQDIQVDNAEDADFFFVPIYGECFLWSHEMLRKEPHAVAFAATSQFFLEALSIIREEYQWWNKTNGRDHIFVFAGLQVESIYYGTFRARGPTIFQEWQDHISNSIFFIPEGDREWTSFNTWKDVVIPGLEYDEKFTSISNHDFLMENPPNRKYLAHFRGTIHHPAGYAYSKGLRPRLERVLQNEADVIYDTKRKECNRSCYREEMSLSEFCLNPLGWTPWTLRFYQAVFVGCIPVMIANNIEFPFEDWLDYTEITLKLPENSVDNIVDVMRELPESVITRKRQSMAKVWKSFSYQTPSEEGDAFYSVMNLLNKKKRITRNSAGTSWS